MKTYKLTCWYQMCATIDVDAENLKDAIEKVQNIKLPIENAEFVNDSFEIDQSSLDDNYPEEAYNI